MGAKPTSSVDPKVLAAVRAAFPWSQSQGAVTLGAVVYNGACHPEPLVTLPLAMMNRHGLIAGATGTGKTKTLQLIAEQLSAAGVPVFLADLKGDLSGVAAPGETNDKISQRASDTGYAWAAKGFPVEFLCLTGERGAQLRATVSSFGPLLLAKVLGPQRDPGERAVAGLQVLRRPRAAAARPSRPADGAAVPDGRRGGRPQGLRRHVEGHRRRAAARDGRAGAAGRAGVLRRARVRPRRPDAHRGRPGARARSSS